MKFPLLFEQIHGKQIFNLWVTADQPPYVSIIPQELLVLTPDGGPVVESVTIVTVQCWNDKGMLRFAAATPADLKVAEEWAARHKDTPSEDFKWLPLVPEKC